MQIEIYDIDFPTPPATRRRIHRVLDQGLGRYAEHIERIEMRMGNPDGPMRGGRDRYCTLLVLIYGEQPVFVDCFHHEAQAAAARLTELAAERVAYLADRRQGRRGMSMLF